MTTKTPAATPPKLTRMELIYKLEGCDPETVTVHNRSLIAWDETRGKRQWPKMADSIFLFQTFICWHHLNRTGVYTSDFNAFQDACEHIESVDDEGTAVDPTQPGAISG